MVAMQSQFGKKLAEWASTMRSMPRRVRALHYSAKHFLTVVVIQMVSVVTLQSVILGLGDFTGPGGLGQELQLYAVLYLVSPAARHVTGQLLSVDGNVEWES